MFSRHSSGTGAGSAQAFGRRGSAFQDSDSSSSGSGGSDDLDSVAIVDQSNESFEVQRLKPVLPSQSPRRSEETAFDDDTPRRRSPTPTRLHAPSPRGGSGSSSPPQPRSAAATTHMKMTYPPPSAASVPSPRGLAMGDLPASTSSGSRRGNPPPLHGAHRTVPSAASPLQRHQPSSTTASSSARRPQQQQSRVVASLDARALSTTDAGFLDGEDDETPQTTPQRYAPAAGAVASDASRSTMVPDSISGVPKPTAGHTRQSGVAGTSPSSSSPSHHHQHQQRSWMRRASPTPPTVTRRSSTPRADESGYSDDDEDVEHHHGDDNMEDDLDGDADDEPQQMLMTRGAPPHQPASRQLWDDNPATTTAAGMTSKARASGRSSRTGRDEGTPRNLPASSRRGPRSDRDGVVMPSGSVPTNDTSPGAVSASDLQALDIDALADLYTELYERRNRINAAMVRVRTQLDLRASRDGMVAVVIDGAVVMRRTHPEEDLAADDDVTDEERVASGSGSQTPEPSAPPPVVPHRNAPASSSSRAGGGVALKVDPNFVQPPPQGQRAPSPRAAVPVDTTMRSDLTDDDDDAEDYDPRRDDVSARYDDDDTNSDGDDDEEPLYHVAPPTFRRLGHHHREEAARPVVAAPVTAARGARDEGAPVSAAHGVASHHRQQQQQQQPGRSAGAPTRHDDDDAMADESPAPRPPPETVQPRRVPHHESDAVPRPQTQAVISGNVASGMRDDQPSSRHHDAARGGNARPMTVAEAVATGSTFTFSPVTSSSSPSPPSRAVVASPGEGRSESLVRAPSADVIPVRNQLRVKAGASPSSHPHHHGAVPVLRSHRKTSASGALMSTTVPTVPSRVAFTFAPV